MEAFGVLIALALIGAAIVLPIWAVAAILNLRRQAQSDRQEGTRHWQDLTARLHVLETKIEELKN
jgi:cell division protein FtsB